MVRLIIGPETIKKDGLDRSTKSIVKRINRIENSSRFEILFLNGVDKGDIHYIIRHLLKILDIGLTIITQVDLDNVNDEVDFYGNKLKVTIKIT